MPFLDLDGIRFHYQQKGQGADVILLHAVTSNMAVWLFIGIVEAVRAWLRVLELEPDYDFTRFGRVEPGQNFRPQDAGDPYPEQ